MGEHRVHTAHTADLTAGELHAARDLLGHAFEGDFGAQDWEHCLGGLHALVWEGNRLAGHASLVQRQLLSGGRVLRTGYVEAVAVPADLRLRGVGSALMTELERVVRGGYRLGALSASQRAAAFYASRGWQLWQGTTWALTPQGPVRTPEEDGSVFVYPAGRLPAVDAPLTCDYREGDLW